MAVSQLAAAGNTVTLHRDHGVIKHDASGKEIRLQREGGIYIFKMWVSGFPRQGA